MISVIDLIDPFLYSQSDHLGASPRLAARLVYVHLEVTSDEELATHVGGLCGLCDRGGYVYGQEELCKMNARGVAAMRC